MTNSQLYKSICSLSEPELQLLIALSIQRGLPPGSVPAAHAAAHLIAAPLVHYHQFNTAFDLADCIQSALDLGGYQKLMCRLPQPQFSQVVFALEIPPERLARASCQAEQAAQVLAWADSCKRLDDVVNILSIVINRES